MSQCHNHTCYRDSETGDLYCPAHGGWQIGGCPEKEREEVNDNDNERNDENE